MEYHFKALGVYDNAQEGDGCHQPPVNSGDALALVLFFFSARIL